ncbi:hypothetical protein [Chitinibacter sp. GC72]|uniref:hypothetical protein n=1 Tax=Chitinibacter sp. GC72 TaxID=1526917 RepID=UPI0012FCB693|nr:hypothetical protein [Chitinibacter sp. GC72]
MKTDLLLAPLGKQADTPIVLEILKTLGFDDQVKIKSGESDAYLNNYENGISIVFKSEEYIQGKYGLDLPSDAPILTAIFLYGGGNDEFSQYSGVLPNDLNFSDGQKMAREKMGNSDEFDEEYNSESWSLPNNVRLFIDYSDDRNSIVLIQYGIVLSKI